MFCVFTGPFCVIVYFIVKVRIAIPIHNRQVCYRSVTDLLYLLYICYRALTDQLSFHRSVIILQICTVCYS